MNSEQNITENNADHFLMSLLKGHSTNHVSFIKHHNEVMVEAELTHGIFNTVIDAGDFGILCFGNNEFSHLKQDTVKRVQIIIREI